MKDIYWAVTTGSTTYFADANALKVLYYTPLSPSYLMDIYWAVATGSTTYFADANTLKVLHYTHLSPRSYEGYILGSNYWLNYIFC